MIDPAFVPIQSSGYRLRPSRPARKRRSLSVLRGFAVFLSILIGLAVLNADGEDATTNIGATSAPEGQSQ